MPRPIRAAISGAALAHNLAVARRHAGSAKVWAVIKANAYGHGIARAAKALAAADGYALLDFADALRLREAGVHKPILLLEGVFKPEDVPLLAQHRLTPVIHNMEQVEMLGERRQDWRVTMIDTGIWRNIGERLWAVRDQVKGEEMFLANYSDGLTDLDLTEVIRHFEASDKVGCFVAVRPPLTYHLADIAPDGKVQAFRSSDRSDIWINGGYFIFRPQIFDYMRDGEELVLEPFDRLIREGKLMAWKHEGFWRSMDTLRDRQVLEDMVERGEMPWLPGDHAGKRRPRLVAAE